MTPRRASLRVAHARACANANRTALDSAGRGSGCTCRPSYYVQHRDRLGKTVKSPRVKDRRTAERLLQAAQQEIDEGRAGLARPRMTVDAWLTIYERNLRAKVERGERKPRTLRAYRDTWRRMRDAFGELYLDEIEEPELQRLYDALPEGMSAAGRDRVLREMGAVFSAAVRYRKQTGLERNPVSAFRKELGLRLPKRGKAPFEPEELERLYAELGKIEPTYEYVARLAVETGLRLGELVGLEWPAVNLTAGTILVEKQVSSETDGPVPPKNGSARTIYLTPYARAVLEKWIALVGVRTAGPVFPDPPPRARHESEEEGGPRWLQRRRLQRAFETAREAAGIPKEHPTMRDPRTGERLPRSFHSLRYSASVLMQRRGYHPRLIEETLGHGSLELTYGVYGGWSGDMLAAEAARDPQAE